jgi:hypothetical protein
MSIDISEPPPLLSSSLSWTVDLEYLVLCREHIAHSLLELFLEGGVETSQNEGLVELDAPVRLGDLALVALYNRKTLVLRPHLLRR